MVITLTLNPSIDKYGEVDNIKYEDTMRVNAISYDAGGKGINVSRVLSRFGIDNTALFFSGGKFGALFRSMLDDEKVDYDFVQIEDNTRLNYTVFDKSKKEVLKLNAPGPEVSDTDIDKIIALIEKHADKNAILVMAGSLPPNTKKNLYARIINAVEDKVKYTFLDTESDILVESLKECHPTFIKPNISETGRILGRNMKTETDFIEALKLLEDKVKYPLVSAASLGVFFKNPEDNRFYNVIPPQVQPVSTVGAGDSFVAGFCMEINNGASILDAVKKGASCGTATVLTPGTQLCFPEDVEKIAQELIVRKMD